MSATDPQVDVFARTTNWPRSSGVFVRTPETYVTGASFAVIVENRFGGRGTPYRWRIANNDPAATDRSHRRAKS